MSVAATRSEISHNPGKMSVTSAVSGEKVEGDVQSRMKLFGAIQAMSVFRSRMPDNEQIGSVLEYAIGHSPVDLQKLSPEGRVLIDDFRDTLETLRMIVHEKNTDELFQNAVWSSYHSDVSKDLFCSRFPHSCPHHSLPYQL